MRALILELLTLLSSCARGGVIAMMCCALTPSILRAQSGDPDTKEVAGFGGGIFGIGNHAAAGGSTGLAFSRYGIGLIEFAYSPMGEETLRRRTGSSVENSRLFDFNGSFHVRIPVRERWAPYAIVGAGLLFDHFRTIAAAGSPDTVPQVAVTVDEFNFAFHTGGGLRYYVRPEWGIRPEFRVIVSNRTYTRFTIGIFYNLPASWAW